MLNSKRRMAPAKPGRAGGPPNDVTQGHGGVGPRSSGIQDDLSCIALDPLGGYQKCATMDSPRLVGGGLKRRSNILFKDTLLPFVPGDILYHSIKKRGRRRQNQEDTARPPDDITEYKITFRSLEENMDYTLSVSHKMFN